MVGKDCQAFCFLCKIDSFDLVHLHCIRSSTHLLSNEGRRQLFACQYYNTVLVDLCRNFGSHMNHKIYNFDLKMNIDYLATHLLHSPRPRQIYRQLIHFFRLVLHFFKSFLNCPSEYTVKTRYNELVGRS